MKSKKEDTFADAWRGGRRGFGSRHGMGARVPSEGTWVGTDWHELSCAEKEGGKGRKGKREGKGDGDFTLEILDMSRKNRMFGNPIISLCTHACMDVPILGVGG